MVMGPLTYLLGRVNPGDTLELGLKTDPATPKIGDIAVLDDVTTGQIYKRTGPLQGPSEAILAVAGAVLIPDFGTVSWTDVTLNGQTLASYNPTGNNLIEHPNHPKVLVRTTTILAGGKGFENRWTNGG